MKKKTILAWLLSFVMVIVATMSGNVIPVRAAGNNLELAGATSISGGTFTTDNGTVTVKIGGVLYTGDSKEMSVAAIDTQIEVRLEAAEGKKGVLRTGGDSGLSFPGDAVTTEGQVTTYTFTFQSLGVTEFEAAFVALNIDFEDDFGGGNQQPPEPPNFDGISYFVWRGENDALCVHKITGLDTSVQPDGTIDIIYIPVSDVKDDTTQEQFEMENNDYYWLWSGAVAEDFISNYSTYSALREALESDEDTKHKYAIDPCGAENGKSTICTNGNREFRATIYDSTTFEGVEFSNDKADYDYFPNFWDPNVFSSTVDISGSTAANPAVYESFLSEPAIHFGSAANSVNVFTGIRALDVPAGAVTISGDGTNGYDIQFGSNFFDNVIFEITTARETYYLEIVRTALQVHDTMGPGTTDAEVVAEVYYEENESYDDYDVYATIYYQDGSTSIKKLSVSEIEMDMMGNPLPPGTYELDGGDGLKLANFNVSIDSSVVGVYFNAVKSGAFSGDSYEGSYFGSGNGVYYDIESRDVVY